jgi:hypothetical protein
MAEVLGEGAGATVGVALPPTMTPDTGTGMQVERQTVVLELHIFKPGFSRKIRAAEAVKRGTEGEDAANSQAPGEGLASTSEDMAEDAALAQTGMDTAWISVSQALLDRSEIRDISHCDDELTSWIKRRAVPSPMMAHGFYTLPLGLVEEVDARVQAYLVRREEKIDEFGEKWTALKEDARRRRGSYYREEDYPDFQTGVRPRYRVEARWISYNTPAALLQLNRDIHAREEAKARLKWEEAAADVRDALRVQMLKMVSTLEKQLGTDEETGKRKSLNASGVLKFQEFLSFFEARNLTNDDDLAALTRQARELITGVDPEVLRKDGALRDKLAESFENIRKETEGLVTVRKRVFIHDEPVPDDVVTGSAVNTENAEVEVNGGQVAG